MDHQQARATLEQRLVAWNDGAEHRTRCLEALATLEA